MTLKKLSLFTLLVASPAIGGGISGGGGVGALRSLDLDIIPASCDQPDVGLKKLSIPAADFRRALARLSVAVETTVEYQGETLAVTQHACGIIETAGERQVIPEAAQECATLRTP